MEVMTMKKIMLILIAGLLLLSACGSDKEASTITADGTATIKIQPDQAVFYISIQTLEVKTSDIQKIGKYLDAAVKNGATGINSINLDLSEEKKKEVFNEALMKAGAEAKEKAEVLAK